MSLNPVPDRMRNVGGYDRLARVAVGLVLLGIAVVAALSGQQVLAVFGMIASAGMLVNAALGLDTCSYDPESE